MDGTSSTVQQSIESENVQVQGFESIAVIDELGSRSTRCGTVLQSMPRESIYHQHVVHLGMKIDDAVLVNGVVFVKAGPRALELDGSECRNSIVQSWPNISLEEIRICVFQFSTVVAIVVFLARRRDPTEEISSPSFRAFRAEIGPSVVDG